MTEDIKPAVSKAEFDSFTSRIFPGNYSLVLHKLAITGNVVRTVPVPAGSILSPYSYILSYNEEWCVPFLYYSNGSRCSACITSSNELQVNSYLTGVAYMYVYEPTT